MRRCVFSLAVTLAIVFACQNVSRADDNGAAIKALFEQRMHETGPACKMFSKSEVAGFIGKPVQDGHVTFSAGKGCSWHAVADSSGTNSFVVDRVPSRYYSETPRLPKFRRVTGIGSRAFICDDGGWFASAVSGETATAVRFLGRGVPEATALKALRIAMTR